MDKTNFKRFFSLLVLGFTITLPAQIPATLTHHLESRHVGEKRDVFVSLPSKYAESGQRYPVVYLLDGEINFNQGLIGGIRYLESLGAIPEFILVGIKNTDRSKDVWPEVFKTPQGDRGGRGNPFLAFLREELAPFIDQNYRTHDYRILYGTSSSAFLAIHGMFQHPEAYRTYIASSAMLSSASFQKNLGDLVKQWKGGTRRLLLVMGEHDYPTVIRLNAALKDRIPYASEGLICSLKVLSGEAHVPAASLPESLKDLFRGWKPLEPLSEGSLDIVLAHYARMGQRLGIQAHPAASEFKSLCGELLEDGKPADSLRVARAFVEAYPESPVAMECQGKAHEALGQLAQAAQAHQTSEKMRRQASVRR